ncbi:MAG: DMT family transporter [Alphaproteobacteria bacterium]|nr:DMT family transporter [Alphaproteobacteria bacterium]
MVAFEPAADELVSEPAAVVPPRETELIKDSDPAAAAVPEIVPRIDPEPVLAPRGRLGRLGSVPAGVAQRWSEASGNLRATIMTIASIVLFSVMLTDIKLIGTRVPLTEILLIRQIIVTAVIVHFFRGSLRHALRTNSLGLQIMRGLFSYGSQLTQFIALLYIPLAEVTGLSFSQVIFITVGAAVILRESVGWRRWLATIGGFCGVIIMLLPAGGGQPSAFALLAVLSGLLSAGVSIAIRSMARTESAITIMLYQSVVLCVGFIGPAAWWWVWPTGREWWLLVTIGIFGSVAQYLFTRACQIGEASALAPLEFSRLLLAVVIGYFVFAEVPTLIMLAGATIVIGSTVYTVRHNA